MSFNGKTPARGSCIISEDVIAGIATSATLEIPGVAAMAVSRASDIRELISMPVGKSVIFHNEGDDTILDVYVSLYDDTRIPEVATAIQKNIKSTVQSMTGTPVTKVNVHVMDVKPSPVAPDAAEEE
ncbi:MAG: Asp23/Gls24 family envelope stress response protein [Clostridia bacterium]|nr:Asp23/Gls24 family envelope stress response protein [Clostridia bacterium]